MTINIVDIEYSQTGESTSINNMGMRAMQARAFESRNSQYLLLKAPPASGKSQLPQLFPCRHHKLILSYYPPSMNFEQKPSPAVSQLYFIRLSTLFFLKSLNITHF